MPFIPPMLCSRLERLERLTERRYIAEPKLDGQRAQVHIRDGRTVSLLQPPRTRSAAPSGHGLAPGLLVARRRCRA
jgi:hypothetical protein